MQFNIVLLGTLLQSLTALAVAIPHPEITPAAKLFKREQKVLAESVWLSTSGVETLKVTPTLIDGVTISASPNTKSATPWISLDKTGIPYRITPTVSGGTTISASPTPTDSNYPKVDDVPPVLRCFGDRVPNEDALGSPFCTAQNGTELLVGEIYWITWDPSYWGGDVSRVTLQMRAYPVLDNDSPLFTSEQLSNNDGYYPLEITPEMRRSSDAGYFFLNITPLTNQNSNAKHVGTKSGPVLRVITSRSEAITELSRVPSDNAVNTSKEGVKASTIAPAVIVPVVVAIALVAGIFWYLNKKKQAEAYAGNNRSRFNHTTDGAVNLDTSSMNDNATLNTVVTGESANPFKDPVVRTEVRTQL